MTTSSRAPALRVVVLAAGLFIVDGGMLAWGLAHEWPGAGIALLHLALLALVAVQVLRSSFRADRYAALAVLATVAFGPIGAAGVLLAMALERYHARGAMSIEQWHQALFPPPAADGQMDLWRRIGQRATDRGGDPRVTPFLDVLSFGSVAQRQAVVAIIAQQFRPAFAPALKQALRDEHNVIRVQAATVIARLEQEFLDRTLDLEAAVAARPDDPAAILALATLHDEQAFAGLFDPTREESSRARAAEGYAKYLALRAEDQEVELRLARLQLRRGVLEEAEPRLRRLAEAGHASARLWLMETLFAQRRWRDLRSVAASCDAATAEAMPVEASATIELWIAGGMTL